MPRSTHAKAILGPEFYVKLAETRALVVGAGGIGCELLKNVAMTGFGHITLLDLDTIDLSNLNRQFLFRKVDVKQSKAMVAARTASQFNPSVKIYPIHANIKDTEYDVEWFRQFDIVLNALDNLDARRHVNKMCLAADIPLVESGTAGYLGQVQPIVKGYTECFDCLPKPTPKQFPVCTIRSTPSQPLHCIVWAKSYFLPQLFGEEDEEEDEAALQAALEAGQTNQAEVDSLRQQAEGFKSLRRAFSQSSEPTEDLAKRAFDKVFNQDIKTLLTMSDMWSRRHEHQPTALDFEVIKGEIENVHANGANGQLKDQRDLSLCECLNLYLSSVMRLATRLRSGEPSISFDKDDVDTLDFVTAASNLRSHAYKIPLKTKWEVKEMAGNIIPAIATTNAIIAGVIVLQALHLLRRAFGIKQVKGQIAEQPALMQTLRNVNSQAKPSVPLAASRIVPPNEGCQVCHDTFTSVRCNPTRTTLRELVEGVLGTGEDKTRGTGMRDVSVFESARLLADPDFDDNMESTLESLAVTRGKFVVIVDEDQEWGNVSIAISELEANGPAEPHLVLPSVLPLPKKVEKNLKRKRSETPPLQVNGAHLNGISPTKSPSKKQRLEMDGLVIIEDDEVITID